MDSIPTFREYQPTNSLPNVCKKGSPQITPCSVSNNHRLQFTTREIADNMGQAAQGLQEVNENVSQTSAVSSEIAQNIAETSHIVSRLSGSGNEICKYHLTASRQFLFV